jgi:hypothetical protein
MSTFHDALSYIAGSASDEEVDRLTQALRDRRRELSRLASRQFEVGDEVVFSDRARPQVLRGMVGTITGHSGSAKFRVMPKPGQVRGRWGSGEIRQVPATMLAKIVGAGLPDLADVHPIVLRSVRTVGDDE